MRKEKINYIENDYVKSSFKPFIERNEGQKDIYENPSKTKNLNDFIEIIAKVESDQKIDARNPTSSASGEFQFVDSAVDTGINRGLRNSELANQEWFTEFQEHRDITKLSREQQTAFFLQDMLERKGTDKVLNNVIDNFDYDTVKDFYFGTHHTDPDEATIKRFNKIASPYFDQNNVKKKSVAESLFNFVSASKDIIESNEFTELMALSSIGTINDILLNTTKEKKNKKNFTQNATDFSPLELDSFDIEDISEDLENFRTNAEKSFNEIQGFMNDIGDPDISGELLESYGYDDGTKLDDLPEEEIEQIKENNASFQKRLMRIETEKLLNKVNDKISNSLRYEIEQENPDLDEDEIQAKIAQRTEILKDKADKFGMTFRDEPIALSSIALNLRNDKRVMETRLEEAQNQFRNTNQLNTSNKKFDKMPVLFNTESYDEYKANLGSTGAGVFGGLTKNTQLSSTDSMVNSLANGIVLNNIKSGYDADKNFQDELSDPVVRAEKFPFVFEGLEGHHIDYIVDNAKTLDHAVVIRERIKKVDESKRWLGDSMAHKSSVGQLGQNLALQLTADAGFGIGLNMGTRFASAALLRGRQLTLLSPTSKAKRAVNSMANSTLVSYGAEKAMVEMDANYYQDDLNIFIGNAIFDFVVSAPSSMFSNVIPRDYLSMTGKTYSTGLKSNELEMTKKVGNYKTGDFQKLSDEEINNLTDRDIAVYLKRMDYDADRIMASSRVMADDVSNEGIVIDDLIKKDSFDYSIKDLEVASDVRTKLNGKIRDFRQRNPEMSEQIDFENTSINDLEKMVVSLTTVLKEGREDVVRGSKKKKLLALKERKDKTMINPSDIEKTLENMERAKKQLEIANLLMMRNQVDGLMYNKTRKGMVERFKGKNLDQYNPFLSNVIKTKRLENATKQNRVNFVKEIDDAVSIGFRNSRMKTIMNTRKVLEDNVNNIESVNQANLATLKDIKGEIADRFNRDRIRKKKVTRMVDNMAESVNIKRKPKESLDNYSKRVFNKQEEVLNKEIEKNKAELESISKKYGC